MKIMLVCKVYPTSRPGGMGFVCQDRARELAKQGHEVHVVTTSVHSGDSTLFDDWEVTVKHLACKPSEYSEDFSKGCVEYTRRFDPDTLHLDSFDNQRPWWREIKKPKHLGLTMHGFCWGAWMTQLNIHMRQRSYPNQAPTWDLRQAMHEREYMLDFDTVIGISLHEHWILQQLMGLHNAKLVYNPIADYFHTPPKRPTIKKRRRFICAAVSGHYQRGFDYACKAAGEADVDLVTLSNVPREKIPEWLDDSDGLILPTAYAQGLDLSVGEAIARRRPVIVTATGSYLREAEGAYKGCLRLVPLVDPLPELVQAIQGDLTTYWAGQSMVHLPAYHVSKWLEVMQ